MPRIHRLPESLINQIAAGEVVERPASVVKELAENSIDAGATTIRVALLQAGLQSIVVTDDGRGMGPDDARLSLQRHATSKLLDRAGLFTISTKGFRGEALPSIASVSHFRLVTGEPEAREGTEVRCDGGGDCEVCAAAPIDGTSVWVQDLFFNVPARRKFLKREATELSHCTEAVGRLALAHPDVHFELRHGGRLLLQAPSTDKLSERIAAVAGSEVLAHLLPFDEARLTVRARGCIASPEYTLHNARGLYTFVNRRYVRDRALTSAVQRGFGDALPPGRQPFAVIFVEIDPAQVDQNVHPQKLEVRFADASAVSEVVYAGVRSALKSSPWAQVTREAATPAYEVAIERFLAQVQQQPLRSEAVNEPWRFDEGRPAYGTGAPKLDDARPGGFFAKLVFKGELAGRYWLCEGPGGSLVVVDPFALAEKLERARLESAFRDGTIKEAGRGLFQVDRAVEAAPEVLATRERLAEIGVAIEPLGPTLAVVRALPVEGDDNLQAVAELIASAAVHLRANNAPDALGTLARYAARSAAVRVSHEHAHKQLAALGSCEPSILARGAPAVVRVMPLLQLPDAGSNGR